LLILTGCLSAPVVLSSSLGAESLLADAGPTIGFDAFEELA
jgi:hypothetical protein